jgi:type I restriction enzyme R subunit
MINNRNEAQTRRDLIDPVLYSKGWSNELTKVEITPGKTEIIKGKPVKNIGRTDYLLCLPIEKNPPLPIAIVEAKKEKESPFIGIQQAQNYKKKFNVPFAFVTNGHLFCDASEDLKEISLDNKLENFPTVKQILERYINLQKIDPNSSKSISLVEGYKGGQNQVYYYQDAAIRKTIESIIQGKKRILLSLATGTGKTIIAKHLLWKLNKGEGFRKALFLVDRDELRTQATTHLQGMFGDDAQIISSRDTLFNAKILIASYQTLNFADEDKEHVFWNKNFPKNYFSHIIIDECHRSAWGRWSKILEDNPNAVQIGLTATPRLIKGDFKIDESNDLEISANNIKYFGEPIYEYSISAAQEDGYLAACEVYKKFTSIDTAIFSKEEIKEKSRILSSGDKPDDEDLKEKYSLSNFERDLILEDRIKAMCEDFFESIIKKGGPHQKTIIFCVTDNHASLVQIYLNGIYNEWCKKNNDIPKENYCIKCTAAEKNPNAKDLIADIKSSKNSHFIATTVDLLSTGVDIPNLENIVFFKNVNSPISFYQMIGRGTRTGEPRGSKLLFRVFDYTNASRLFGKDFISNSPSENDDEDVHQKNEYKIVKVPQNEFKIQIINEGVSILSSNDGKEILIPYEEYKINLAKKISNEILDLENLRNIWISRELRNKFLEKISENNNSILLIQEIEKLSDCDLFDVISFIVYSNNPLTKIERSNSFIYKNRDWLENFSNESMIVISTLAKQFSIGGIEELESSQLFEIPEIKSLDGLKLLENEKYKVNSIITDIKYRLLK